jgi:uncharacterized protein YkwD
MKAPAGRLAAAVVLLLPALAFGQANAPPVADVDRVARLVVGATNEFRRTQGLRDLAVDARLTAAARQFAEFMARTDKYAHDADGKTHAERAGKQGYEYCRISENIAYRYSSAGFESAELARGFIDGWKNSPPHRKNMLDPVVTQAGVGVARSGKSGRYYAVQMFAKPLSAGC